MDFRKYDSTGFSICRILKTINNNKLALIIPSGGFRVRKKLFKREKTKTNMTSFKYLPEHWTFIIKPFLIDYKFIHRKKMSQINRVFHTKQICEEIKSSSVIGPFKFQKCRECDIPLVLMCFQTINDSIPYNVVYIEQSTDLDLCYDCDMDLKEAHFEEVNERFLSLSMDYEEDYNDYEEDYNDYYDYCHEYNDYNDYNDYSEEDEEDDNYSLTN